MTPLNDLDFEPVPPSEPTPTPFDQERQSRGSRLVIAAVAVLVAFLAVGGWYWWSSGDDPTVPATAAGSDGAEATGGRAEPLGTAAPVDLPPLDALDPFVRSMLQGLSARPELASLLATDNLLRRFVVSVENIGRGATPVRQLSGVRVDGAFSVEQQNARSSIAPATFARYDALAATVSEIDPAALATIYGQLRPRLNEAYGELGAGTSFDAAMEHAIVHLLSVSPDLGRGQVRPVKGVTYAWVTSDTENLSSAQKQLLRMGPENARRVQTALRNLALALGIPAERLPR